jgi:hypothetical protein
VSYQLGTLIGALQQKPNTSASALCAQARLQTIHAIAFAEGPGNLRFQRIEAAVWTAICCMIGFEAAA